MTREEAITIIRKEYLCVDRDCDIERSCGRCDLMMPSKEPILQAYKMAIQALEQELSGDAVSREAAIDIFDKWLSYGNYNYSERNIMNCAIAEIKELPSYSEIPNKWIPVSERLPEPMQIVLVTQRYNPMKYQPVTVAQFNGKYFMWYGYQQNWGKHTNICEHGDICAGNEYIDAWMPLPKPYEPQESEE